jgi:hypothetical protein
MSALGIDKRSEPGRSASGLLQIGVQFNRTRAKSRKIQQEKGADRRNIPYDQLPPDWKDWVPEYVPGRKYTKRELTLMAELMLVEDPKPNNQYPAILTYKTYKDRLKREIYVASGIPDPSIVQGMYWRTHPEGRKVSSEEQRKKNGASFYL